MSHKVTSTGNIFSISYTHDEADFSDVVKVIRCKDCKWFGEIGCAIYIVDDTDKPKETDFCSFAERAEEEK